MSQKILVIGGTGRTGRHIVQKLKQYGYEVRALARNADSARKLIGTDIDVVTGDITQAASVKAAMDKSDGCVICVESADSDHVPNSPERVHYEGMLHVLAAASHAAHIVLVSQIYITRPERYPEVKNIIHWRDRAEQALRTSDQPYTIVRPSWLTDKSGGYTAIRFEQGDTGEGEISREDVAEICALSLHLPEARGKTFEIYNVPGKLPEDWRVLFGALAPDDAR